MTAEPGSIAFPLEKATALPCAHGGPSLKGVLRARPEDFQVEEILGYPLKGSGEHLVVKVRKRELNTLDVAKRIARWGGVGLAAVGFAGLKDRHAVTIQHFSAPLPGTLPADPCLLEDGGLEVLEVTRHDRKLRRGELEGNRFVLRLSALQGDREVAQERLQRIAERGIPNYFGPQRFGRDGSNLVQAQSFLSGKMGRPKPEQRRMLLSAVRSYIFNRVLAARVIDGSWERLVPGEVALQGQEGRQVVISRPGGIVEAGLDVKGFHPSGPLSGRVGHCLRPEGAAARVEMEVLEEENLGYWADCLSRQGVRGERRPLGVIPSEFDWEWGGQHVLGLSFQLPAGCYATVLVRELMADRSLSD